MSSTFEMKTTYKEQIIIHQEPCTTSSDRVHRIQSVKKAGMSERPEQNRLRVPIKMKILGTQIDKMNYHPFINKWMNTRFIPEGNLMKNPQRLGLYIKRSTIRPKPHRRWKIIADNNCYLSSSTKGALQRRRNQDRNILEVYIYMKWNIGYLPTIYYKRLQV